MWYEIVWDEVLVWVVFPFPPELYLDLRDIKTLEFKHILPVTDFQGSLAWTIVLGIQALMGKCFTGAASIFEPGFWHLYRFG